MPRFRECRRLFSKISARETDKSGDIAKPEKVPLEYWKKIICTGIDMKKAALENQRKCLKLLDGKHVTLLFGKPHGRFQLAFTLACDILGARKTLYYDGNFENQPNPGDSGRVLAMLTDMFVIHGLHHDVLAKLTKGATIPVFPASCNVYCFQKALSDLMTIQEKFRGLKGLTLAWVGPPNSIFNAYLLLCSRFGISVRYFCMCSYGSGRMSPVHLFPNSGPDYREESVPKEFKSVEETVKGAHVVATSMHPETKNKITMEVLRHADPHWLFMHTLPRTPREVSDEVFNHEKNMSWMTSENYLYVAMAVILTGLSDYEPKEKMSEYDKQCS